MLFYEKKLNCIKKLAFLALMLFSICIPFHKVSALYYDTSYYDAISWVYTYQAPYTSSYNCLGWATGSMTWEWPSIWGESATYSQTTNYLVAKGYYLGSTPGVLTLTTKIIAYGPSSEKITHFAKVSNKNVTAKWGQLERFSHGQNANPYYSSSAYGLARISFTG